MTGSPTARSLAKLRKEGWHPWIVETFNHFTKTRSDMFGFIDILAIRGDETLAIQATSYSNVSARVKKIAGHDSVAKVRAAGWGIEVWGWHKVGRFWQCRVVDCS